MDIISLLITIAGIIIILALYLLGRVSRNKMPQEKNIATIPNIVDENGNQFTSVLDDIPASDGSTPKAKPASTPKSTDSVSKVNDSDKTATKPINKKSSTPKKQNILFISAKDAKGIDGNQIDKVFTQNGLNYGDMDIYHFMVESNDGENIGLFRVANGVDPWTLRPQDLNGKWIPGLSLLLVTPSPIDDKQAIETFVNTAQTIANQLNGELKNQQQQVFTQKDKEDFLSSL